MIPCRFASAIIPSVTGMAARGGSGSAQTARAQVWDWSAAPWVNFAAGVGSGWAGRWRSRPPFGGRDPPDDAALMFGLGQLGGHLVGRAARVPGLPQIPRDLRRLADVDLDRAHRRRGRVNR